MWRSICWVLLLLMLELPGLAAQYHRQLYASEDAKTDTLIGTITGADRTLQEKVPPPYTFIVWTDPSTEPVPQFRIEKASGRVSVAAKIEREVPLPASSSGGSIKYSVRKSFTFQAVSQSGQSVTVTIHILDVNDNAPRFSVASKTLHMSEGSSRSTKESLGSVTDPDNTTNSINGNSVSIASGNTGNTFRVEVKRVKDVFFLDLALNRDLDYERTASYDLVIKAVDGGSTPKTGTLSVRIIVVDTNDNSPIFHTSRYSALIPEDTKNGSSVLTVTATDQDSAEHGRIRYSIKYPPGAEHYFEIDAESGEIFVVKELDYEQRKSHKFIVAARDCDSKEQLCEGTAAVSVDLENVNDNAPVLEVEYLNKLSEETAPGEYLARISVSDPDVEEYDANVTVNLVGGHGHFRLTTSNNVIYLVMMTSRVHNVQLVRLSLLATDSGSPPLSSTVRLQLLSQGGGGASGLTFVNTCRSGLGASCSGNRTYLASLEGGGARGKQVATVKAKADDVTQPPRTITYHLTKPSSAFSIDAQTGVITTRAQLDCDVTGLATDGANHVMLLVQAEATEPRRMTSTATVLISVKRSSTTGPVFSQCVYFAGINEAAPIGSLVYKVNALSQDDAQDSRVEYQLTAEDDTFAVTTTGAIRTKKRLDREGKDNYVIGVLATSSTSGETTSTKVNVTITDANDNRPQFGQPSYTANIRENEPKGSFVLRVVANDVDLDDNAKVTYALERGPGSRHFGIDSLTGRLYTTEVLDYEVMTSYTLHVRAYDLGSPQKASTPATITVDVEDVEDTPIMRPTSHVTLSAPENTRPGDAIGYANANLKTDQTLSYYILTGNLFDMFGIDKSSGSIFIARKLDYEVCSQYNLQVLAQDEINDSGYRVAINVTIEVLDLNDNTPIFDKDVYLLRVKEDMRVTQRIGGSPRALDADSGPAGELRYKIQSQTLPGGDWFEIDAFSGVLSLVKELDAEKVKIIDLVILAEDQSKTQSPKRSTTVVQIKVENVNDNIPTFQSRESIFLGEDEPVDSTVALLLASDPDHGPGGHVVYTIVAGNKNERFALNAHSGELTVVRNLDRETTPSYELYISARDSAWPYHEAVTKVTIGVNDVNDNAPRFSEMEYRVKVKEEQKYEGPIATVSADDTDTGLNSQLTYSIPLSSESALFSLDPKSGEISLNGTLDREKQELFNVTVQVRDAGKPVRYDVTYVIVEVEDVNDHAPRFASESYSLSVLEHQDLQTISTMFAVDEDSIFGRLSYTITAGNERNKFTLDPSTGDFKVGALDREQQEQYNLTVKVTDGQRSDVCRVNVVVIDINDNAPQFLAKSYSTDISEASKPKSPVVKVTATDGDVGQNGLVTYAIDNNVSAGALFDVHNVTGQITTTGFLDRETQQSYIFDVVATDGGLKMTRVKVHVTVTDENDNAPVFIKAPFRASIATSLKANALVATVEATDRDIGANGAVRYTLPTPSDYFDLQTRDGKGQLRLKKDLSPADESLHRITILAKDGGQIPKTTNGAIEVQIGNAALQQLQFDVTELVVNENADTGHEVALVRVRNTPPGVSMRIISGNQDGAFLIDSRGSVKVAAPSMLDYETWKKRVIVVEATSPSAHGYANATIKLQDVNDNTPMFFKARYKSAVWEGNNRKTFVTQLTAHDRDSGVNGAVTYSIVGGNGFNVFEIEPDSAGIVKTKVILDREIEKQYRLVIEAKDGGGLSSSCELIIDVIDVNDNKPRFPQYPPLRISEDAEIGRSLFRITANDLDLNPILRYSILNRSAIDNAFAINRSSGLLRLVGKLDYEKRQTYNLIVQVSDRSEDPKAGPHYFRQTTLRVIVQDRNDNAPRFSSHAYQVTVPDLTGPRTAVATVTATDADSGENARLTYALLAQPPGPKFYINEETGVIYNNHTLRVTPSSEHRLVVTVRDNGATPKSAVATVRVTVEAKNNFQPVFEQSIYRASIDENKPIGSGVLQVTPDDLDAGAKGKVDYFIQDAEARKFFQVDLQGQVIVAQDLDREARDTFSFSLMARDRGSPARSATCSVTITLNDVNDNAPKWQEDMVTETEVDENVNVNHELFKLSATDADTGSNGQIVYKIISGNAASLFGLHPSTGKLYLRSRLDFEKTREHRITVRAEDGGQPQLFTHALLTISLRDVNEFKPAFPTQSYSKHVGEQQPIGTSVFTAYANDLDGAKFGVVTYSLAESGDSEKFVISPDSGLVSTNAVFQQKLKDSFAFNIIATDIGGLYHSVATTVTIIPRDAHPPTFTKPAYSVGVPGNAKRGDVIGQCEAEDKDGGRYGLINFSLEKDHEYFDVDSADCQIYVIKDLQGNGSAPGRRMRRALEEDIVRLVILARSGFLPRMTKSSFSIKINRSCAGCGIGGTQQPIVHEDAPIALGIVLGIVFSVIVLVVVVVIIAIYMKNRGKKRAASATSSFDSLAIQRHLPPPYNDSTMKSSSTIGHNMTTSEVSDQSHSASSGRGSAEDDEDEEIRMINATPAGNSRTRMPDSGIAHDDEEDSASCGAGSILDHKQYLANLGIDSSKIEKVLEQKQKQEVSMNNIHTFAEESGSGAGLDISQLIYAKVDDVTPSVASVDPPDSVTRELLCGEPSHKGELSAVINTEEETGGAYNWDYLLNWGPQFQPLAEVFAEIASLKDERHVAKTAPVQVLPLTPRTTAPSAVKSYPPPIITNTPPSSQAQAPLRQPAAMETSYLNVRSRADTSLTESGSENGDSRREKRGHKVAGFKVDPSNYMNNSGKVYPPAGHHGNGPPQQPLVDEVLVLSDQYRAAARNDLSVRRPAYRGDPPQPPSYHRSGYHSDSHHTSDSDTSRSGPPHHQTRGNLQPGHHGNYPRQTPRRGPQPVRMPPTPTRESSFVLPPSFSPTLSPLVTPMSASAMPPAAPSAAMPNAGHVIPHKPVRPSHQGHKVFTVVHGSPNSDIELQI